MTVESILTNARAMIAAGQTAESLALLDPLRRRHPGHFGIALLSADALHAAGQLRAATDAYAAALRIDDCSAEGWFGAGCAQLALQAAGAADACLSRAAVLAPRSGPVLYNLAKARFGLGRIENAIALFEQVAGLDPDLAGMAQASIACIIPGNPEADHAAVLHARRRWVRTVSSGLTAVPAVAASASGRKLRIGYLSAFFGSANWMKPVFGLINRHDRAHFELYMLSDGELPSAASGYRDRDSDYIYDLRGVTNEQAAGIIGESKIDVLVDLNGYSHQTRLPLLMHRPAPHIVAWFNMFATTGIDAVDWLIGDDEVIEPAGEAFYTERIHRVPGTYLAFEVLYDVPEVAPPPCLANGGGITFGCLGSHYKLTGPVLAAWARILLAAPGARLFIKNAGLEDASVRTDLLARLRALGIGAERITLHGRSPHFDFLDAYRHIDIALDTFPYNGGTTTTEALWQGVPVLTFNGDRWASRTSRSLLVAAGLRDWVVPDVNGYIGRAAALANDPAAPAMLAGMRHSMRARLRASAACDADGLCAAMEAFYRAIARDPAA